VLLGLASLVTAACGGGSSARGGGTTTSGGDTAASDLCAGTSPHTQVVVYSTTGLLYWYNDVLTNFQLDCAVAVVFQTATGAQTEQRLAAEKAKPYADIVIAEAPHMAEADAAHLLEPDGAPGSTGVPDDRCGPHRHWCDVAENYLSWVYNPALYGNPPRTWQDLLAPRFAGHVVLSDLERAEDGRSLLVLLDHVFGRAGALRYLADLEGSVKSHWVTTDSMSRVVASGSALAANGNLREDLNDILQYHNVAIWFPALGSTPTTMAVPYGAALVRGGRNRANAIALLKYMWSKAAQAGLANVYASPARTDVVPDDCRSQDIRRRLAGVRILRPDWNEAARDEKSLAAAWLPIRRAPQGKPLAPAALPPLAPC
jgi:2-aminoethylphosphonate transport system substrate-binding protein